MCAIYLKHGDELVAMVEQPYQVGVTDRCLPDQGVCRWTSPCLA
jgi:hypothetical protein